jgi:pSer/pThr/pTyr-binding forkhead associated (FHA) protein
MGDDAPKLIVLSEQLRGTTFELTEDIHTCGRVDEREITIKDTTISTHHCDFVRTGSTYTIRDKGSTNGTRVNNVPITEQELQNSDILQVGGVEILYDCDDRSVTTVMRTQTGIDLDGVDAVKTVKKMDGASSSKHRKGGTKPIVKVVIILLVLLILGLLLFLVSLMLKATHKEDTVSTVTTTDVSVEQKAKEESVVKSEAKEVKDTITDKAGDKAKK